MKANNIKDLIGNTPLVKLNKTFPNEYEVWIKMEKSNPGGSIKDRIALSMIEDAERKGLIGPGSIVIEPTSGNTGVGLAMICAVKGYKLILVMPESMSIERRKLMACYGAEFVLTPRERGMPGAIEQAQSLLEHTPNSWSPAQFDNPANYQVHYETTGKEIVKDIDTKIDYLITGVGTGGHISGVGKAIKEQHPQCKVFAVEPVESAVIAGGEPGPHAIQGIGAGFIPKTSIWMLLMVQ